MQAVNILSQVDPILVQSVVLFNPETKSYVGNALNPLQVQVANASTAEVGLTDAQLRASPLKTEPLGIPDVARQVIATNANTNTVLTTTCRRISIKARISDVRFALGSVAQTASATTGHFIEAGERLDMAVPANANIAVIRDTAATADAVIEITELA